MEPTLVGLYLMIIGGILLLICLMLILVGLLRTVRKTSSSSFQYFDKGSLKEPRFSFQPHRLHDDPKIEGKVIPRKGNFDLMLHDCFGWIPRPGFQWQFPTYVDLSGLTPEQEKTFSVFLPPGDYMLMFVTRSLNVEALVELNMTHYMKPLKKLIDVGLALLQVAIPILVTGFVIYTGFTSV